MVSNPRFEEPKSALLIAACSTDFLLKNLDRLIQQFNLNTIHLFTTDESQAKKLSQMSSIRKVIFENRAEIGFNTYRTLKKLKHDILILILANNTKGFYARLEILAFALPAKKKWHVKNDGERKFPNNIFYKKVARKFFEFLTAKLIKAFFSVLFFLFFSPFLLFKGFFIFILFGFSKGVLRRFKKRSIVVGKKYKNSWRYFKDTRELGTLLLLEFLVWMDFVIDFRFSYHSTESPKRVLFIRLDHIGDVINSTPALRAIRTTWPKAFITLAIGKWTKEVIKNCPYIDEVLIYSTNNKFLLRGEKDCFVFLKQLWFFVKLRTRNYDIAIDPSGWPETYKLIYMSGAKRKIANDYGRWNFHYNVLRKRLCDNDEVGLPESKRTLNLLQLIGIKEDNASTELWLSSEEERVTDNFLKESQLTNSNILGFHPGAFWPQRRWPIDRFAQLADKISAKYKLPILVLAGPGEEELIEQLSKIVKKANIIPVIKASLREIMAIILRCSIFVCNDSGPMHIAVAFKVPTVAIFGPGGVARWAPPSPPHVIVRNSNIDCIPCSQYFCQDNICIKSISLEQVWKGTKKLIGENK